MSAEELELSQYPCFQKAEMNLHLISALLISELHNTDHTDQVQVKDRTREVAMQVGLDYIL